MSNSTVPDSPVSLRKEGDISIITIDDGKANVFGLPMTTALSTTLDEVDPKAGAVVIAGRPGMFSAGFDLNVVRGDDPEASSKMRRGGIAVALKAFDFPRPIVAAVTGHSIAMGAIFMCGMDWRVGAQGNFKHGLSEVKAGLVLPMFGVELVRFRIDPMRQQEAILESRLYSPDESVGVGFLDEVVDPEQCLDAAIAKAQELAELPNPAYAVTKLRVRGPVKRMIEQGMDADLESVAAEVARFS